MSCRGALACPELDELAKVLPERAPDGRFYWQPFVDRIEKRFDGLPAPDGGESFVRGCLAAGCRAVPVIRRNTLWENRAPPLSDRRARGVFELRIRLGLFFAASLRYLVHGACRLRANVGDAEWHAVTEQEVSFRDFLAAHDGELDVAWSKALPDFGAVCLLAQFFFTPQEVLLLTPALTQEVFNHVRPEYAAGLFGRMLSADGQVDKSVVDVAGVFLEALVGAVDQKQLRVNTRVKGHVFIAPRFWFVTYPAGVGDVARLIRSRREGRRYNFTRDQIVEALSSDDCLVSKLFDDAAVLLACEFNCPGWNKPLVVNGLAVKASKLPGLAAVEPFAGNVRLQVLGILPLF